MTYEVKVNELAEEFGVHRNTIRNWINSGTLPAKEGPGRRYLIKTEDYLRLCEKYGRKPKVDPAPPPQPEASLEIPPPPTLPPVRLAQKTETLLTDPILADTCQTCGTCAGACPISGVDGLDPRKLIRMAILGLEKEILSTDWPWKCTMCGKCEQACPMNVEIVDLIRLLRSKRARDRVPAPIQKGVVTCLEKGNNLGIPKDDFLSLLTSLGEDLARESSPGFVTPIDVRGARILVTINSKEPFADPYNLFWWWKIFTAAQESWTISSTNWEGVNWGIYSGDDKAMKTIVERIVENLERLNCQAFLLPECGHAYYATLLGLQKWFPEALEKYKFYSAFDLLIEYINEKKFKLDPATHRGLTTYHDSCNYGRKSLKAFGHGYFEEGRFLIRSCCREYVDMVPNRESSYCCGAGGGAWASPFAVERVYHGRMKARQIKETGAELVIVSCHNCRDQLAKSLNLEFDLGIKVKYIWELVADSLIPA